MRSVVLRSRIQRLSCASSFLVLSSLFVGCSTDFDRFSRAALPSGAQSTAANNPYPGDIDGTTTASISRRMVPASEVVPPALRTTPQAAYHAPEPTYAAPPQTYQQQTYNNRYDPNAATQNPYAQPSYETTASVPAVQRKPLPLVQPVPVAKAPPAAAQPIKVVNKPRIVPVTPPKVAKAKAASEALPVAQAPVALPTAPQQHLVPVADVQPTQANTPQGWNAGNGTQYTVKSGETLYNLSKRFGVPVSAIMAANQISDADTVQSGQIITIPNYSYSESAPVSAPDSNPLTQSARATTGQIGEASTVITPLRRPQQVAAIQPNIDSDSAARKRYVPKKHAAPPKDLEVPDHSIVTGSVDQPKAKSVADAAIAEGNYVVVPGDSLSRIAANSGVSVNQLKAHNGLDGDSIRIGQTLKIPGVNASSQFATNETDAFGVDPMVTGSVAQKTDVVEKVKQKVAETAYANPEASKKPKPAVVKTDKTANKEFRWPVKGRVLTKFNEKDGSVTNDGIDISVPEGTAIRAAENGEVIYAGSDIAVYGNLILIRHADGWVTAYAHVKSFDAKKGTKVRRGQIIARSGRTGQTTKPKLHFEVRKNSTPVDPTKHLPSA